MLPTIYFDMIDSSVLYNLTYVDTVMFLNDSTVYLQADVTIVDNFTALDVFAFSIENFDV